MSRIEFSNQLIVGMSNRMMRVADVSGSYNAIGSSNADGMPLFAAVNSTANSSARIIIMQGVMPTDTTSLTTPATRATDTLVIFDSLLGPEQAGVTSLQNVTTLALPYVIATRTGTATWFWWQVKNSSTSLYHSIIGSIGVLGSGADLEVNDINVVTGGQYRVTNLRITWPTTLDW